MIQIPKSWAALILTGENLDPELLSKNINLNADYYHKPIVEDKILGHWQINSHLDESIDLDQHLWDLVKRIAAVRKEIKPYLETNQSCIYCSVEYADMSTDGITIDHRVLTLLGSLGISIKITPWKSRDIIAEEVVL
jgi:hypothetical protein